MNIRAFALIILTAGFTACSREELPALQGEHEYLMGKWQLTAILSGQSKTATGWVPVSDNYSETIILLPGGGYSKMVKNNGNTEAQTGRYSISEGNMLTLNPENNQQATTYVISENTGNTLILEKPVKNGLVKISFVRVTG